MSGALGERGEEPRVVRDHAGHAEAASARSAAARRRSTRTARRPPRARPHQSRRDQPPVGRERVARPAPIARAAARREDRRRGTAIAERRGSVDHERNGSRLTFGTVQPSRTVGSGAGSPRGSRRYWWRSATRPSSPRPERSNHPLVAGELQVDEQVDAVERGRGEVREPLLERERASAARGVPSRERAAAAVRRRVTGRHSRTRSCRRRPRAPHRSSRGVAGRDQIGALVPDASISLALASWAPVRRAGSRRPDRGRIARRSAGTAGRRP